MFGRSYVKLGTSAANLCVVGAEIHRCVGGVVAWKGVDSLQQGLELQRRRVANEAREARF
jgi:hypothetical protein